MEVSKVLPVKAESFSYKLLMSQAGQMAIFIALIFQALFMLFAMAINVALFVHDKINLQNAVDLAAYYAAQRQAEVLNVIAHQNFQIRQAWKLAAWRYRVLGTAGRDTHPVRPNQSGRNQDVAYWAQQGRGTFPSICASTRDIWTNVQGNQNICAIKERGNIPQIPRLSIVAPFVPGIRFVAQLTDIARRNVSGDCNTSAARNWFLGAAILTSFRFEQANRRQVIDYLADNLSRENSDFKDIDGESVRDGAAKVVRKNLTYPNRSAFEEVVILNSLGGYERKKWLPPVEIFPEIFFTHTFLSGGICQFRDYSIHQKPNEITPHFTSGLAGYDPGKKLREIVGYPNSIPTYYGGDQGFKNYSLGYEKNPWYMAYVGVQATARPRALFFPFGPEVVIRARAYAKPFGGRIGPWYAKMWPAGQSMSMGVQTDLLVPPRQPTVNFGSGVNTHNHPTRQVNHSRFPGDTLGMNSRLALSAFKHVFTGGNASGRSRGIAKIADFYGTYDEMIEGRPNDSLSWSALTNTAPQVRRYELAAIKPDIFDITYYSIEPNFKDNYLDRLQAAKDKLGIPSNVAIRGDFGNRKGVYDTWTVTRQIEYGQSDIVDSRAYYYVRKKEHLLTSWTPGYQALDFDVSKKPDPFGECQKDDAGLDIKNPGSCVVGGRTGYSVKLVSRQALVDGVYKLGGDGSSGQILNQPPQDGGW